MLSALEDLRLWAKLLLGVVVVASIVLMIYLVFFKSAWYLGVFAAIALFVVGIVLLLSPRDSVAGAIKLGAEVSENSTKLNGETSGTGVTVIVLAVLLGFGSGYAAIHQTTTNAIAEVQSTIPNPPAPITPSLTSTPPGSSASTIASSPPASTTPAPSSPSLVGSSSGSAASSSAALASSDSSSPVVGSEPSVPYSSASASSATTATVPAAGPSLPQQGPWNGSSLKYRLIAETCAHDAENGGHISCVVRIENKGTLALNMPVAGFLAVDDLSRSHVADAQKSTIQWDTPIQYPNFSSSSDYPFAPELTRRGTVELADNLDPAVTSFQIRFTFGYYNSSAAYFSEWVDVPVSGVQ